MNRSSVQLRDGRSVLLRRAVDDDAAALTRAVDSVAREQIYFIRSRFEVEEDKERAFIARARAQGDLLLLALHAGEVIGWLTLFRPQAEFLRHTAQLGMGVVAGFRDAGLGTALLDYALHWAAENGLEKINLGVRASNSRARALYRRFGFIQEGYRVRDIKDVQGQYDDTVEMAYFVPQSNSTAAAAAGTPGGADA
jgi:RimJ/RimL family protein N-acetyltransferase